MIDVLTLNYNDAETTIDFVKSVKKIECIRHILIVDNQSTDNSVERLKKIQSPKVSLICTEKNGGYGYGNNCGIRYLSKNFHSEYILLANPDVIIEENALKSLEKFLSSHEEYAIVAPLMKNNKREVQYNTAFRIPNVIEYLVSFDIILSKIFKPLFYKKLDAFSSYMNVGAVSGSLFMMDCEKMIRSGMYDEGLFLYCEEHVLGIKMKKSGYKTALLLNESFIHNHSVSIKKSFKSMNERNNLMSQSRLFVLRKYYTKNILINFIAKILLLTRKIEIYFLSMARN